MNKKYQLALRRIQEAKKNKFATLNLSGLQLTQLPKELFELTNLAVLKLDKNKLSTIPDAIGNLANLNYLYLNENELKTLPDSIGQLTNLTALFIGNNELKTLPDWIGQLTQLTTLFIGNNELKTLPDWVGQLTQLTRLGIENNELKTLPDSIGQLTNLTVLSVENNELKMLPDWIGQLTQLTALFIGNNELKTLPDWVGQLTQLTRLDIENNELKTLPDSIDQLTQLTRLSVANNELKTLPDWIGQLTQLQVLTVEDNALKTLPDSIGQLNNLIYLTLETNQLTFIPKSIEKLVSLNILELRNNHFNLPPEIYDLPPQELIQQVLKWQTAHQAKALRPIHEAKVIFIGESNYGKTHLIELLKKGNINREIKTTHGIERSQLSIPYQDNNIRLNIWDLGGQEFMRSTHQFFFSERTLYVLVTLARRERNELNHWLKLANQLGDKAPVLVVINKIDEDSHDLDRKSLERDYPNIIGFVRTCIYDCDEENAADTIARLKKKIIATVTDKNLMPSVFEQRPPDWFTVKEELEKLEAKGIDFITYQDYEQLNFIKDLEEIDRKTNLKLLSMIGAIVSFVDDPRLVDTNVINPQWIMDGVYKIINDPKIKDITKGQLDIHDLERILPKNKFPKARHVYLLELMKKFDLCYAAKDQKSIYFIPDLFEDIEPPVEWNHNNIIQFRYDYDDFPPDVFMTRFIVEMHQDIFQENRWRSGVYISNGSCQAKVYQSYRKNYIHVEVVCNGGEGRSYLYAIRDAFRKLHKPFPQMEIKEEVLYKEY